MTTTLLIWSLILSQPGAIQPLTYDSYREERLEEIPEEDIDLLAHVINAEAGSSWCTEEMQKYTGSVVLNRVADEDFPDNLHDVVYQRNPTQYACTTNGMINYEYTDEIRKIAEDLLVFGSVLPGEVVFQSQRKQGHGTYAHIQNQYYCYK